MSASISFSRQVCRDGVEIRQMTGGAGESAHQTGGGAAPARRFGQRQVGQQAIEQARLECVAGASGINGDDSGRLDLMLVRPSPINRVIGAAASVMMTWQSPASL